MEAKAKKCRFFAARKCSILHAGAVGERRLRVFHHGKSSARDKDSLQENDRLMRQK
jgi:hypothetical protein